MHKKSKDGVHTLHIAICDDMLVELQRISLLTNQYIAANNLDAEVTEFSHPDELLTVIESNSFHLYILDIVMPLVNGLELGKEIRRLDREVQTFAVKTADSLRVLKLSDIVCCEYHSHAVVFSLTSGEEFVSRTIRERFSEYCAPILKDRHFLQCHTSYVVNMRRVERFTKDGFTLFGGKFVPISPKQYAGIRDTYMDYVMAKGGQHH